MFDNLHKFINDDNELAEILSIVKKAKKIIFDRDSKDPILSLCYKSILKAINGEKLNIVDQILPWSVYYQNIIKIYNENHNFRKIVDKYTKPKNRDIFFKYLFYDSNFLRELWEICGLLNNVSPKYNSDKEIVSVGQIEKIYFLDNPDVILIYDFKDNKKVCYMEFIGLYKNWELMIEGIIKKHMKSMMKPTKGLNYIFTPDVKCSYPWNYWWIFSKYNDDETKIIPIHDVDINLIKNKIDSIKMLDKIKNNKFKITINFSMYERNKSTNKRPIKKV